MFVCVCLCYVCVSRWEFRHTKPQLCYVPLCPVRVLRASWVVPGYHPSFFHSFILSLIHSIIHSFIHSFIHLFIHSIFHSFFLPFSLSLYLCLPSLIDLAVFCQHTSQVKNNKILKRFHLFNISARWPRVGVINIIHGRNARWKMSRLKDEPVSDRTEQMKVIMHIAFPETVWLTIAVLCRCFLSPSAFSGCLQKSAASGCIAHPSLFLKLAISQLWS